ncbi:MAG: 4Fe-4S dicluster domain-containing protein [bacterium]
MAVSYILSNQELLSWVGMLSDEFNIVGPIKKKRGQVIFEKIEDIKQDIALDYCSTMLSPRNVIYPSIQKLFHIDYKNNQCQTIMPDNGKDSIILGVHSCDMHAVTVLDRIFLGGICDIYYDELRQRTVNIVLNCNKTCGKGFCLSMGTGPFLQINEGYDLILTKLREDYLVEVGSERGKNLIENAQGIQKSKEEDLIEKDRTEKEALRSFKKIINTDGLAELLLKNLEHPVYQNTAEARCLGCTNCTMVCPTCYCYTIIDDVSFDLQTIERKRYWDSCQELNFAGVHDGNFRATRKARLRQFVTHKLGTWVDQYGCFGCIGCGRCMTWCPTGIDLTEIAKEIQSKPL